MKLSRRIHVLALAAAFLAACLAKKDESKPADTPGTAEPGKADKPAAPGADPGGEPAKPKAPTMEALHPVIRESAEEDVVPSAIVIELAEPIADPNQAVSKKTRV